MDCVRGHELTRERRRASARAPCAGFPLDFFPVLFAVPRVVGWLAHWRQMMLQEGGVKIWRPRQVRGGSVDFFPAPGLLLIKRSPRRVPIAVAVVAGLRWTRETRLCARGGACWGGRPEEDAVEGRAWRVSGGRIFILIRFC